MAAHQAGMSSHRGAAPCADARRSVAAPEDSNPRLSQVLERVASRDSLECPPSDFGSLALATQCGKLGCLVPSAKGINLGEDLGAHYQSAARPADGQVLADFFHAGAMLMATHDGPTTLDCGQSTVFAPPDRSLSPPRCPSQVPASALLSYEPRSSACSSNQRAVLSSSSVRPLRPLPLSQGLPSLWLPRPFHDCPSASRG